MHYKHRNTWQCLSADKFQSFCRYKCNFGNKQIMTYCDLLVDFIIIFLAAYISNATSLYLICTIYSLEAEPDYREIK